MMKNKYIKFFKKELIFLLVLLIVVCFSFGITYSNFIYNSENKRAVEMFAGALNYNIKINDVYQNNIILNPGSNIVNIEIESINDVSSYYKLLTNSDVIIYSIEGSAKGIMGSKDKANIKLYIVNNQKDSINISFIVSMGYITNTLDDVIIKDNYHEIDDIKNEITYDNKKWIIEKINEDASIDLISKDLYSVKLSGYSSYNNLHDLLNSKCTTINSRSIDENDIADINIVNGDNYININRLTYYPIILKNSNNVIINDNNVYSSGYGYSNNMSIKNKNVNENTNISIYSQNKYLLNTNYYEVINNEIKYYVIELNNGVVNLRKLYDSSNANYEITSNVRCKINIKDIVF